MRNNHITGVGAGTKGRKNTPKTVPDPRTAVAVRNRSPLILTMAFHRAWVTAAKRTIAMRSNCKLTKPSTYLFHPMRGGSKNLFLIIKCAYEDDRNVSTSDVESIEFGAAKRWRDFIALDTIRTTLL